MTEIDITFWNLSVTESDKSIYSRYLCCETFQLQQVCAISSNICERIHNVSSRTRNCNRAKMFLTFYKVTAAFRHARPRLSQHVEMTKADGNKNQLRRVSAAHALSVGRNDLAVHSGTTTIRRAATFSFRRTITGRRIPDANFIPLPASRCLKPKVRTKAEGFHISAAARKSRVNSHRYARTRKVILRRACAIANIGSPCCYCPRHIYARATDYEPSPVFAFSPSLLFF